MAGNARILLVEDDLTVTETMKDIFRHMGLFDGLQIASNGQVALEMIRLQKFDLVILDLMLPIMNGIQLLEILNNDKAFAGLRIMVNSTQESRHVRERVKDFKNIRVEILPRPFDPMEFAGIVQALTRGPSPIGGREK